MNECCDESSERLQRSYDDIPYFESNAFTPSDPQNLAVCAAGHGLVPPDPEHSRVLELACGCGGNLVSLANLFPNSHFTGVDLSEKQITEAVRLARHAGTDNVQFINQDIMSIGEDIGTFDYIIAHGVFSWIPGKVQERILELCASHLKPDGLAMISYMVYPGGSIADTLRDIMHIHLEGVESPYQRLEKGREFLALLADSGETRPHPMSKVYSEVNNATKSDVRVFYHEYLNIRTDTLYFRDFALRAAEWGLTYVDDALRSPDYNLDGSINMRLRDISTDRIQKEQYIDYLVHRSNRHSILCKQSESLTDDWSRPVVRDRYICSSLHPGKSDIQMDSRAPVPFRLNANQGTVVSEPMLKKALLVLLQEWPRGLFYSDLLSRLSGQGQHEITRVSQNMLDDFLLKEYSDGLLELRLSPPPCTNRVSDKPKISKLARFQAVNGNFVTNQRHMNIPIGKPGKLLLPLLDGTNELASLAQVLVQNAAGTSDAAVVKRQGTEAQARQALEYFRRASLLIA